MRYAMAVWNFCEPDTRLLKLVEEFADLGFDAVSFLPKQVLELDAAGEQSLRALLDARSLVVTIHGNFDLSGDDVSALAAGLGPRLISLTMDAAKTNDSRGQLFDTSRMARLLSEIESRTRGSELLYGIEDFPLDALAVDFYREDLAPALDAPRFGTLIDLGHMNLRRHRPGSFNGLSPQDYLARVPLPIIEIHVHDNSGDRDSHQPIGDGSIDFTAVAEGLRLAGFEGVSTIEVVPGFHGAPIPESKPRARDTLEHWRELWRKADPEPAPSG